VPIFWHKHLKACVKTGVCSVIIVKVKDKGNSKVHPITGHEGSERKKRYSSTLSLT
jgi:hypothetical protein